MIACPELYQYLMARIKSLEAENTSAPTLERLMQVKGAMDEMSKLLTFLNAESQQKAVAA